MTDKKKGCGCSNKKEVHNALYHEEGRNGWTPTATNPINPKMLIPKAELVNGSDYDIDIKTSDKPDFGMKVLNATRSITDLLIRKNRAYGNTALNPTNVFSKLSAKEAICARIDDKLSRISNTGLHDETEDTVDDLIGYLLLLKMAIVEEK